jgi:HK97 gp10 family phage protein
MAYVESGIYVEGLNAMLAGLAAISSEATKEVQALNRKVGVMVRDEARQLVPVGETGNLKGSIRYTRGLYGAFIEAGNAKVPYAAVQNWGWFYDKNNFITKNIKPTQFLNKAAAKVRKEVSTFYIDELVKIYEKYSGKSGTVSSDGYNVKSPTVGRRY